MGFVQPGEEAAWRDFTAAYCYLMGRQTEIRARPCLEVSRGRMTVNKPILQQETLQLDIRKKKYHEYGQKVEQGPIGV